MIFDPVAAEAELDLAWRKSRNELILGAIPFLMSVAAAVGLRRQRNQLRAALAAERARQDALDATVIETGPIPDNEQPGPLEDDPGGDGLENRDDGRP